MTIHVGFTGTRYGLNNDQRTFLYMGFEELSLKYKDVVLHHGKCKGADEQAHKFARHLGFYIVGHPSDMTEWTADVLCDEEHEPQPPLYRNHNIVDECSILFACPQGKRNFIRSGTWATIRYAASIGKLVMLKGY